ncbi:MAG: DUF3365 domain-containing protein [Nitrospinota bacterium]
MAVLGKRILRLSIFFLFACRPAMAVTDQELKSQSHLIADFLITGRGVVAESILKYKINDATIGGKGFTPEIFEQNINTRFRETTGVDILAGRVPATFPENTLEMLRILLQASKKVVKETQPVINMKGVGFKGFIPATYGRMVADTFREKTGISIKQTSLRFRNTYNAPDPVEQKVLSDMESPGYKKGEAFEKREATSFRLMKPVYIKKSCLGCHGGPAGELDVAGRKKEGYKEGDLRGAISIQIPLK